MRASLIACAALAAAAALLLPRSPARAARAAPTGRDDHGGAEERAFVARHRLLLAGLAAAGGVVFLSGLAGWVAGAALAVGVWWTAARAEPPGVRREREAVRRELPHLVRLVAVSLDAGVAPATALETVSGAFPGRAADSLRLARSRLALGALPSEVWAELAAQPGLEPLGRALLRTDSSGARVAETVHRLADDLVREARLDVEDRARTVGIRAAVPLGVCLLPAFLLVGIVPVVAAAAQALAW